jgi:hypothetical protein
LTALIARGCAQEIVVVNRERKTAEGLVGDAQYGAVLCPYAELRAGDYSDLKGAALVMIIAGVNEQTGGATFSEAAAWSGSSSRRCPTGSVRRCNAALIRSNPHWPGWI